MINELSVFVLSGTSVELQRNIVGKMELERALKARLRVLNLI
jgi:hypothetical protein